MEHNLFTRYQEYMDRREKLSQLKASIAARSTPFKNAKYDKQLEALATVHQSVLVALSDRTKHHARRYGLDSLVKRFNVVLAKRNKLVRMRENITSYTGVRLLTKHDKLASELEVLEQELMAEAVKALDRIIDLESRNE